MAGNKTQLVNYEKWAIQIARIGYITSVFMVLSHVIWFFAARSILAWPPEVYLRNYIILPAIGLFCVDVFTYKIVHSSSTSLTAKEYFSLLQLVLFSFYLSITHDIAKVLLCSYLLPLFASSIFANASLTRHVFIVSVVAVLLTGGNAFLAGKLDGGMIMEIFVVFFLFVCAFYLIEALIRFNNENLETMKRASREAINNELAFYQAQIQPHFLCNAINTIISFCYKDAEKAAELIANLTNYLRFSFDINSKLMMVTLEKEIQLIMAYVEIEKARFGELISVEYNIAPELLATEIPSFCLQPLVENSIKHGLLKKEAGGSVTLTAKSENDVFILSVSDTGVGMSNEKRDRLINCKDSGEGVGLYNVKRRVMGWKDTQFDIQSEEGAGTTIVMRMPSAVA